MPKGSSFKLSPNFKNHMRSLREGMEKAATEAMGAAMAQAERDAQGLYPWHHPGEYAAQYGQDTWQWTVTGLSAATITGYVVPNKKLKNLPSIATTSYWNGIPMQHVSRVDPTVTQDYAPETDKIKGIVTMYTHYAPFLQDWETGAGGQKNPVTVEVLEVNWETFYVPKIIRPIIEQRMATLSARFK